MARIKQVKTASPGILLPIIVVIYKTTNLGAEVARVVLPTPHTAPEVYEFADVDPGVYAVKHYASADGIALSTLLKDFNVDAVTNQVLNERILYTVDSGEPNAPVSTAPDQFKLVDPYLDGKVVSGVFKEGFRYLKPAIEWEQVAGGRLNWLLGISNSPNETWAVEITYQVALTSAGINDPFSQMETIIADVTLNSTHYNKTLLVNTAANKQTTSLPTLGAVPDGKGYVIVHDGGNAINVVIKAFTGEAIRFRSRDYNQLVLGTGESVKLIKRGTKWYALQPQGQWDRVGEFIGWHSQIKDNAIPLSGGEYDPVTYVRLGELVDSLDPSLVKTYAEFDQTMTIRGEVVYHNRGFFARDAGTGKIKVPDLRDKHIRFLKNFGGADAERVANVPFGYQHDGLREHWHEGAEAENGPHGSSSTAQAGPLVKLLVNIVAGTVATIANFKARRVWIDGVGAAASADTRGKNVGLIPLLLI
jgi:hypothetical protein